MSAVRVARIIVCIGMVSVANLLPLDAYADHWTAVGSVGTMDESEFNPVTFTMSFGNLSRVAGVTASVEVRFNVVNNNAPDTPLWNTLEMGNYDNSTTNVVTATLYRVSQCTGTPYVICSVASTNSTSSKCNRCTFTHTFDFVNNSYYVYVVLSGSGTSPQPVLRTLAIY